jgi:hypothetical protein
MRRSTAIWAIRSCGIMLAVTAGVVFIVSAELASQLNAPRLRIAELMLYGAEMLIAVSIRFLVFGFRVRKRLGVALLLSVLGTVAIGVLPDVVSVLAHGLSSARGPSSDFWMGDFWLGMFFFIIDFMTPCIVGSVILAAVPIFDGKLSSHFKPTG